MKKTAAILFIAAAAFFAGFGYDRWYHLPARTHKTEAAKGYHCPMHPHIKSDKPGACIICGMALVPDEEKAAQQESPVLSYHDHQAPGYRSDKPGVNPETGNTLVPVHSEATVMVPAEKQQWIGLKIGTVEPYRGAEAMRVPGRIAVDETRVTKVQTRFDGWIDKVNADFTGRLVKKGEPLLTLYSPELTASQQEYLLARKAKDTMEHSPVPGIAQANGGMVEVARQRLLHHWGMNPADIDELERTGQPRRTLTVTSPATGFITMRNAYANQMVKPEMELYTLADLSRVWILADVFESDAAQIHMGQSALIEPSYSPGRKFRARVTNIVPQIDAETRTLKVRLEADNPDFALRPDLFVNVEFPMAMRARMSVPEDAVIDTGKQQTVYVELGEGKFEPRRVEAGERFDGRVEILAGLKTGERIVISGAFLIDSESRMRSATK
jgi:multidrug efflux pump subunit AcrA (membrane-fusion protein)